MDCPSCGTPAAVDARFCSSCGHGLQQRSDERRIVSVLFGDVVGFTTISESRDPEAIKQLIDRTMDRLADDIVSFGGRVDKVVGDGILALFGAPVANEDDAERAVRAALAMQQSLEDLRSEFEIPLQMRIGVNTGEVLVGEMRADGSLTAMGDVVNTASRIQEAAEPGSVVVGAETYAVTADVIDYTDGGTLQARGRDATVKVWTANRGLGLPGHRSRPRLPLLGRELELDVLASVSDAAFARERSHMILILGEAGVGKTRLAEEVAEYARVEHGAFVLSGRCVPYGEANAWFPIADALRQLLGIDPEDDAETVRAIIDRQPVPDAVRTSRSHSVERRERTIDGLLHLLGLESPVATMEPGRRQDEVGRAIRVVLELEAQSRPVLFRFTDLHWADDGVLRMLDGLMRRLVRYPVVILGTARHSLTDRWVPATGRHHTFTTTLDPLGDVAAGELLDLLVPDGMSSTDREALLDRGAGNPLFLEEMATLVASGRNIGSELPNSLRGLVAARLDRLTDAERAVLEDAAVLGVSGPVIALERMAQELRDAGSIDAQLRTMSAHGLLEFPQTGRWRFHSTLVRDVVYGRLAKTQRALRHFGVAEYLEVKMGDRADPATIAFHFRHAAALVGELGAVAGVDSNVSERALDYTRRAAKAASGQEANSAAAGLLSEAIELAGPDHPEIIELRLARAGALVEARKLDAARIDVEAVLRLADPADQAVLATEATLRLGQVEQWSGETEAAAELFAEAVAGFRELDQPRLAVEALRAMGLNYLLAGRSVEAESAVAEALEWSIEHQDKSGEAWARQNLAWLSFVRGEASEAETRLNDAIALFDELDDDLGRDWSVGLMAFVRMYQGRFDEARQMAQDTLTNARRTGDRWAEAMMRTLLASTLLWTGHTDASVPEASEALAIFSSLDDVVGTTQAVAVLGRALIRSGQVGDGLGMLRAHAAELGDDQDGVGRLAHAASAMAAVSVGDPEIALEQLAAIGAKAQPGQGVIGETELLVAQGLAYLQRGDVQVAFDALTLAITVDADNDSPHAVSTLALCNAALGNAEAVAELRERVEASERATYLDRRRAFAASGFVAARLGDASGVDRWFGAAHLELSATGDQLARATTLLGEATAREAMGDPTAVGVAANAEARLEVLGIDAMGWRTASRLCAGLPLGAG